MSAQLALVVGVFAVWVICVGLFVDRKILAPLMSNTKSLSNGSAHPCP
jgi:hypothetical protein